MLSIERITGNAVTKESAVKREGNWQVLSVKRIMGKCCQERGSVASAVSREDTGQVRSVERIMGNAVTRESAVRRDDNWQVLSVERIMDKCCH